MGRGTPAFRRPRSCVAAGKLPPLSEFQQTLQCSECQALPGRAWHTSRSPSSSAKEQRCPEAGSHGGDPLGGTCANC